MKTKFSLLILSVGMLTLSACEKKSEPERTADKVEDKVNDALDRRPGEKVRDAGENIGDKVKDATN